MPELKYSNAELQIIADKVAAIMQQPKAEPRQGPHMRLLDDAAAKIKQDDPDTCVTKSMIRRLALNGQIRSVTIGQKRLINYDSLLEYLSTVHNEPELPVEVGKIRKIRE